MKTKDEHEEKARLFVRKKVLRISYDDLDKEGKQRAHSLMYKEFSWSPLQEESWKRRNGETTFREQFDLFSYIFPEWRDFSRVFFDKDDMDSYLCIRRQRAACPCFMDAVVLFQHYLSYLRATKETMNGRPNHEMLDILWYIREGFSKEKLQHYLQEGDDGSALQFLCDITHEKRRDDLETDTIKIASKSCDEALFDSRLQQVCSLFAESKEPALVSEFAVEEEFRKPGIYRYDGEVAVEVLKAYAEKTGTSGSFALHSMVLVGLHKEEETGKVWFLLQNFWASKYFVIVSAEYLASCHAKITFAHRTVDVVLRKELKVTDAHFVATHIAVREGSSAYWEMNGGC